MGMFRDYISEEADMQTMLFRYSVMVEVFDTPLPSELKCGKKLSDELKKKILRKPYTEQTDRLIFLFGAGIISEDVLKSMVLHNNSDFLSDVIALESQVRINEGENSDDVLTYEQLQKILLLCANSKKYENLTDIGFSEALSLISGNHIYLTDNGFIRCDRELTEFLNNIGETFGFYDADSDSFKAEQQQYINEAVAAPEYDITADSTPLIADYRRLKCYLSVYDKLYGRDFIGYAQGKGISFDEHFADEYERYLNDIKLSFNIQAYPKKRSICGGRINYYDYAVNSIEDNKLVSSSLNADDDYSAAIRLDTDEQLSEAELAAKSLRKYKNSRQLFEDMIVEVIHGGKTAFYIFKNGSFTAVDSTDFRRQLFDFDKIWSIIQMCSREKKIRKIGDVITLPQEYMNEIPIDQQPYAVNMIKEQYQLLQAKKQQNPYVKNLSELKSAALTERKKIDEEKAMKAAEKEMRRQEKLTGRKQSTILSEDNGGN